MQNLEQTAPDERERGLKTATQKAKLGEAGKGRQNEESDDCKKGSLLQRETRRRPTMGRGLSTESLKESAKHSSHRPYEIGDSQTRRDPDGVSGFLIGGPYTC